MRTAITQLRADANIEYLHAPVDAEAQAITETNKAVQSLTRPLVVEDDNPLLNDTLLQNESIERGISGLK